MLARRKSGRSSYPGNLFEVPVGDPIETLGQTHRVACHLNEAWGKEFKQLSVTACGIETSRFRESYPATVKVCPKCWPDGVSCPMNKPRPLVDNTAYFVRNPYERS